MSLRDEHKIGPYLGQDPKIVGRWAVLVRGHISTNRFLEEPARIPSKAHLQCG